MLQHLRQHLEHPNASEPWLAIHTIDASMMHHYPRLVQDYPGPAAEPFVQHLLAYWWQSGRVTGCKDTFDVETLDLAGLGSLSEDLFRV